MGKNKFRNKSDHTSKEETSGSLENPLISYNIEDKTSKQELSIDERRGRTPNFNNEFLKDKSVKLLSNKYGKSNKSKGYDFYNNTFETNNTKKYNKKVGLVEMKYLDLQNLITSNYLDLDGFSKKYSKDLETETKTMQDLLNDLYSSHIIAKDEHKNTTKFIRYLELLKLYTQETIVENNMGKCTVNVLTLDSEEELINRFIDLEDNHFNLLGLYNELEKMDRDEYLTLINTNKEKDEFYDYLALDELYEKVVKKELFEIYVKYLQDKSRYLS